MFFLLFHVCVVLCCVVVAVLGPRLQGHSLCSTRDLYSSVTIKVIICLIKIFLNDGKRQSPAQSGRHLNPSCSPWCDGEVGKERGGEGRGGEKWRGEGRGGEK